MHGADSGHGIERCVRPRPGRGHDLDHHHLPRHTVVTTALNATFFSLDASAWPDFATVVTTDEHDMGSPSNLARPGVFRLNIGVGRTTFERLVGSMTDPDYIELNRVIPHPVYAKQRWVAILNPSRRTFDEVVRPLIAEAYARVANARRT